MGQKRVEQDHASVFEIEKGSAEELLLQEYSSAFSAWNTLLDLETRMPGSLLSMPQRKSFQIIQDWIVAHHDVRFRLIPTTAYLTRRNGGNVAADGCSHQRDQASLSDSDVLLFLNSDRLSWKFRQPECKKSEENGTRLQKPTEDPIRSNYDDSLNGLFEHEFGLHDMYDEAILGGIDWSTRLTGKRRIAALEASCHRIAVPCLEWWSANECEKEDTKCATAGDKPLGVCGRLDGTGPITKRTESSHTISSNLRRVRPSFNVCPWLPEASGLPFYLWDVENERTLETSTLAKPCYTAISHTWGRWRKCTPPVRVKGVDGWLVPENEVFEVEQLPHILRRVPKMTPYIWFDLVCIPQDGSARAEEEIARQAIIFQGAENAIAWLNRVDDWKGMQAMLHWASLYYMLFASHDPTFKASTYFKAAFNQASCPTGLFDPYQYQPSVTKEEMRPLGWFTSLWTLQEACLRPDMLLCNSDWEVLHSTRGVPIALDDVVALTNHITNSAPLDAITDPGSAESRQFDSILHETTLGGEFEALVRGGRYPRAFLEVYELLERTNMKELNSMRPETITLLGAERYCEDSRAEAIMSVLGVTDWYTRATREGKNRNMVLGTYPLEFLRAAANRIGASFFNAVIVRSSSTDELLQKPSIRGSLLPFRPMERSGAEARFISKWGFEEEDHPSVKSWVIQADGSVRVSSAGILASSTNESKPAIPLCEICLAYPLDMRFKAKRPLQNDRLQIVDIQEWSNTWLPISNNYAVALTRSRVPNRNGYCIRGILLKQVVGPDPGVLVKVGVFTTTSLYSRGHPSSATEPDPEPVDWTVL
jgi:hypothetical protein